jgi:ABC-2 type transport system permease protein
MSKAGVKSNKSSKKQSLIQLALALLIVVLLNVISLYAFSRFDLTSEKRYTLSDATKKIITDLKDVVYIKVYLEGEFPAGFKRLRNETKEMLDEFRAYSKENNIQYEFINPSENPDVKKRNEVYRQLTDLGLQPTNLEVKEENGSSQQIIFPGALISFNGKQVPLQLLKSRLGASPEEMLNNSIQALEYELASSIQKVSSLYKSKVAFLDGHGELDSNEVKDISNALKEYYFVERKTINGKLDALDGVKGLIIAKPDSVFTEKDKFVIDQFVMRGGKVMFLIDPIFATMDSLNNSGLTVGIAQSQNLEDMLFRYGVRLNNNLVQDLQAAPIPVVVGYTGNQPQQKLFPWPFFPLIMSQNTHPIVNNLNAIKLEFASSLDTVGHEEIKKTILLSSSDYTKLLNAPVRISVNMLQNKPDVRQYAKKQQPLAALLEGTFTSIYKNRLSSKITDSKDINFKEKSKFNRMIVIADGDVIRSERNKSTGQMYPLGYDRFTNQQYGNKNFILNCVNYLMDDSGLITVRSRELKLRLLDRERIKTEKGKWQVIAVSLPLLSIALLGTYRYFARKRKYTK